MPKVVWRKEALADVDRIFNFLRLKNWNAARRAAQAIKVAGFSLADAPLKGSALSDGSGRRKLIVPFGKSAYIIYYALEQDKVLIVRVHHGRENRPH